MDSILDLWQLLEESPRVLANEIRSTMNSGGDAPVPSMNEVKQVMAAHEGTCIPLHKPDHWKVNRPNDRMIQQFLSDSEIGGIKQDIQKPNSISKTAFANIKQNEKHNSEVGDVRGTTSNCVSSLDFTCDGSMLDEQKRRETLFQIERLLLRARPYDSIGFYYVQRELLRYLKLDESQLSSVSNMTEFF